jgi:transcriptional regulator with XRE-family HTH domain
MIISQIKPIFSLSKTRNLKTMNVGENIKKLRELKNYTQEYMAKALNISPTTYGDIERNKSELTINRVVEIAKVLEVNYLQILEFNPNQIFNFHNSSTANGFYGTVHQNKIDEATHELIAELKSSIHGLRKENDDLRIENKQLREVFLKQMAKT